MRKAKVKKARRIIRRGRASPVEIQQRITDAENDPAILRIGVVEAMNKHKLNYQNIIAVRRSVLNQKILEGRGEELIDINTEKDRSRLHARLLRAEEKFPLIHRRVFSERNMSEVARNFGITRERVRQIRRQFEEYRQATGQTNGSLLDEIEESSGTGSAK